MYLFLRAYIRVQTNDHRSRQDGRTALLCAVKDGPLDIVKMLLEHGADPKIGKVSVEIFHFLTKYFISLLDCIFSLQNESSSLLVLIFLEVAYFVIFQ